MSKKKKNYLGNQKGMSFISLMIATVLMTFLVAVSFEAVEKVAKAPSVNSEGYGLCRNLADNVHAIIRATGGKTETYKIPITSDSLNFSDEDWKSGRTNYNTDNVLDDSALGESYQNTRWPQRLMLDWSGGAATGGASTYLGPHAIRSYMNTIASIFFTHQNNGICSDEGMDLSQLDLSSLEQGKESTDGTTREAELYTVNTRIRIRPYNMGTTQFNCNIDPNTQWPRPLAETEPPETAPEPDSTVVPPIEPLISLDNYDPKIGFQVTVLVGLDRENIRSLASDNNSGGGSSDFECMSTQRYSYEREPNLIAEPQIIDNGGTVTVRYEENKYVLGGTLLCKLTDTVIQDSAPSGTTFNIKSEFEDYQPCNLITTACGENLNPRIEPDQKSVTFDWPNNPDGTCHITFEAFIMDAVGNISKKPSWNRGNGVSGVVSLQGPSSSGPSGSDTFYSVDGAVYSTMGAAQRASQISGRGITPVGAPPPGTPLADTQIADVSTQIRNAEQHANEARNTVATTGVTDTTNADLQTSLATSLTELNGSSASISSTVQDAAANAAQAQANASAAQASAFAAAQSLDATIEEAQEHIGDNPTSTATYAGAISAARDAVTQAQDAADEARAAAELAQALADALREEQQRREDREAEEEEDDSGDPPIGP